MEALGNVTGLNDALCVAHTRRPATGNARSLPHAVCFPLTGYAQITAAKKIAPFQGLTFRSGLSLFTPAFGMTVCDDGLLSWRCTWNLLEH